MPARLLALALLALLTAGCAPAVSSDTQRGDSVTVDVTQGRTDRDGRVIVMDVTNTDEAPIELVSANLDTAQFAEPARWNRGTTLGPGRTVSLRAPLSAPVCPVPGDSEPTVTVTYTVADGTTRTQVVTPTQSTDVLEIIGRDDCIAALTAQRVELAMADEITWSPGRAAPASLTISARSTGDGSLSIVEARSTILLGLVDPSGAKVEALPLGVTVDAGAPIAEITLHLIPNRCDPHAIAEDKRGTIMQLAVILDDGTEGVVFVRSSDVAKAELFAFVTDYCAPTA